MGLKEDMQAFKEKALLAVSENTNKIVEDLLTQVVIRSPDPSIATYSKGHLINQWYTSTGAAYNTSVSNDIDPKGSGSLGRISSLLSSNPFKDRDNEVTMANNTEQAYHAEVLGWPAGQGSNGWVWSGRVGPYSMVRGSVNYIRGKYE